MRCSRRTAVCVATFALIVAAASILRFGDLERRPLHHDEANQAVRFGILLDTGKYVYFAEDHHGPTLYYLTLPLAWITGKADFASTTVTTHRLLPALFGVALLFVSLLLVDGLGWGAVLCGCVLIAVSHAMVFYSRFYIQEMLLVFFAAGALGAGWRYVVSPRPVWAILCGLCIGMTHATKETCVIVWAAWVGAGVLHVLWRRLVEKEGVDWRGLVRRVPWRDAGWCVGAAAAVSILFYSSFFSHPKGVVDSWTAYLGYAHRACSADFHIHPWYFYLRILLFAKYAPGPVWSEGLIAGLACFAAVRLLFFRAAGGGGRQEELGRFLVFYTLLVTLAFSVIPYKTPWNILLALHGMALLAGLGAVELVRLCRPPALRIAVVIALLAGVVQLAGQTRLGCTRFDADPRNPYVYAHTIRDVLGLVRRVEDVAGACADGYATRIDVCTSPHDSWPLPWYFRRYSRIGYFGADHVPSEPRLPMVISSGEMAPELARYLGDDYMIEYYGLRPEVLLSLAIRNDLWAQFLETRSQ